jgi:hypothetical protein
VRILSARARTGSNLASCNAPFARHHMSSADVIDADGEQVAKREEETVGQDVILSAHTAGELRFR